MHELEVLLSRLKMEHLSYHVESLLEQAAKKELNYRVLCIAQQQEWNDRHQRGIESWLERQLQQLSYGRVLILDEIGYLPMNREEASLFFRRLNPRYEKASIILTSNKGFADWGEMFGDHVLATAILDRLLHYITQPR
ncbi:Putative transposase [Escherichia coli]|uniref:Transposase n=1 Tax=Escherichia coli TaxID=562 RepID=A0AAX2KI98_ECOLX|nr:Putative transposase [Escherichia coli]